MQATGRCPGGIGLVYWRPVGAESRPAILIWRYTTRYNSLKSNVLIDHGLFRRLDRHVHGGGVAYRDGDNHSIFINVVTGIFQCQDHHVLAALGIDVAGHDPGTRAAIAELPGVGEGLCSGTVFRIKTERTTTRLRFISKVGEWFTLAGW